MMIDVYSHATCHIEAKESMARKRAMEKKEFGLASSSTFRSKPY